MSSFPLPNEPFRNKVLTASGPEQDSPCVSDSQESETIRSLQPVGRRNSQGEYFEKLMSKAVKVASDVSPDGTISERPLPEQPLVRQAGALKKFKILAQQEGKKKVEEKHDEQIKADLIISNFTDALRAAIDARHIEQVVPWFIMLPDHKFKRFWEVCLIALLSYTIVVLPVREAFITSSNDDVIDSIVDFVFVFDIIMTFCAAYEDADGQLVTDPKKVAMNYVQGWFAIDLFASIPFALLLPDADVSTYTAIGKSLKIPRLTLRMLRIMKLMRARRFQKLFYDLEYSPLVHQGLVRCLKLIAMMLIVGHFSACIWYKMGTLSDDSASWINRAWGVGIADTQLPYQYLASLYWAWQTLCTVGYGDIYARSTEELVVSIFIMTIGATVFSYITATVSSMLQASDSESAGYRERMHLVSIFLNEKRLPPKLQARVVREMGAFYRKQRQTPADWIPLMADMSQELRQEVVSAIYHSTIETSSFCKLLTDPNMITDIFAAGESIRVRPGQYIATYGFPVEYWYLIIEGSIAAVSSGNSNIIYQTCPRGSSLGEIGMFLTNVWVYSLRGLKESTLLRVSTQNMFRIIGSYENATKLMLEKAEKDLAILLKAKKQRPIAPVTVPTAIPQETLTRTASLKGIEKVEESQNSSKITAMEESLRKAMKTLEEISGI